ncbi:GH14850 [Drosophila grimshawi]|uniref:GH14850 n=1 Tax=Drosophila grimshawi TaxID=7222 RepID=B4J2M0_DROGR|nr:GH14850 [Drosophila grimshawi]
MENLLMKCGKRHAQSLQWERGKLLRKESVREQCDEERDPFESTLWYFELLGFLEGQEEGCHKATSSSPEQEALQFNPFPTRKRRLAVKDEFPETPAAPATLLHSSSSHTPTSHRQQQPQQQRKRFASLSASEALAHTWRTQFDEMPKQQQLLAGKLISDVLYYGCMEQLKPSHVTQLQQIMLQGCNLKPQIEDANTLNSRANYAASVNLDEDA